MQPHIVALPCGRVTEQPVAPPHCHGWLQMRVSRHQHVHLCLCPRHRRPYQVVQGGLHHLQLPVEPQSRVRGHLLMPRKLISVLAHRCRRRRLSQAVLYHSRRVIPRWHRHLVVATAPRVELAADCADNLAQSPLVCGVDVFITRFDCECAGLPFLCHLSQSIDNLVRLQAVSTPALASA